MVGTVVVSVVVGTVVVDGTVVVVVATHVRPLQKLVCGSQMTQFDPHPPLEQTQLPETQINGSVQAGLNPHKHCPDASAKRAKKKIKDNNPACTLSYLRQQQLNCSTQQEM